MDIFLPFVRYHAKYIFAFMLIILISFTLLTAIVGSMVNSYSASAKEETVSAASSATAACIQDKDALAFPLDEAFPKDRTLAVRQRFAECVCEFCREHLGVDALPRIQQPCGLVHASAVADGVKAQNRPDSLLFCVLPGLFP